MPEAVSTLVYANYRFDRTAIDRFKTIAGRIANEFASHTGCVFMKFAQDVLDPQRFQLIEAWSDRNAFDRHVAAPRFKAIIAEIQALPLLEFSAEVYEVNVAGTAGTGTAPRP